MTAFPPAESRTPQTWRGAVLESFNYNEIGTLTRFNGTDYTV